MELWDLYDENRVLQQKIHTRGVPIPTGSYHIVVDIWTINKSSNILITQRHPDKPYGMLWECTGGSIVAGEDSRAGALRELSEEVGIHAKEEELILIHSVGLRDRFVDTYITRQDIRLEDLKLQEEEVVDAKLISFEELNKMWDNGLIVPKQRFGMYKEIIKNYL